MAPDDVALIMAGYVEYGFLYYGLDGETPLGDVTSADTGAAGAGTVRGCPPAIWFVQSHYEFVDPRGRPKPGSSHTARKRAKRPSPAFW